MVDLPSFAPIKECIEDATGDELVRRIQDVHPEWDLSFLINENESMVVEEQEKDEGIEVDPSTIEEGRPLPDSTHEGGSA